MSASRLWLLKGALAIALAGCTSPAPFWTAPVATSNVTYGLAGGVAVVDDANHRVVLLQGTSGQMLTQKSFTIGHNFQSAVVSPDGWTLFVLSSGDQPVETPEDQLPSLTVIQLDSSSVKPLPPTTYWMPNPLSNLAVDPLWGSTENLTKHNYVVAWSGSSTSFAENPNEIAIFDVTQPYSPGTATTAPNPISRNIRSFSGTPQQLVYSPVLNLPANAASAGVPSSDRRLLFVETNIDVSIVDLTHAFDPPAPGTMVFGRTEITVQLTSGSGASSLSPMGLVVDQNPDDGRFAFFTNGDTNVYTVQLLPSPAGSPNDFVPQMNLTPVGGSSSDVQFVRTDAGLRVAALVPSTANAVLVEPDTSVTTSVPLSASFTSMALVTDVLGTAESGPDGGAPPPPNTDVALLWSTETGVAAGVALWTLGTSVGQPYRSIEVLTVDEPIQAVLDVPPPPGATYSSLKVLATQTEGGGDFYVLDLLARTASPIHTTSAPLLSISPDGLRMWAYDQTTDLAQIDFNTLNPVSLTSQTPVSVLYDIQNIDDGRSLVAIDAQSTFAATVFNALSPQATARTNVALLLEAP
jgi:hypothetical protein